MGILIISPGFMTTVQDQGRPGYLSSGIPPSGALDGLSHAAGNLIVGNDCRAASLEMTLVGASFKFTSDSAFAVTGADMDPLLNGFRIDMNRAVPAKRDDILCFGSARAGCRTYVAFAGGLDLPVVLGSRSTNITCGFGGHEGRALRSGDRLELCLPSRRLRLSSSPASLPPAKGRDPCIIRVLKGPQDSAFTARGSKAFYSGLYTLSSRSNRMAAVLSGPFVESASGTDIVSDALASGSIQVVPDGSPIVMLADRPTTGGYAKIATVIGADVHLFGQLRPGDSVRFQHVTHGAALRALRRRQRLLDRIERSLSHG